MIGAVLVAAGWAGVALIALAITAEVRRQTVEALLAELWRGARAAPAGFSYAMGQHPRPLLAAIETLIWLLLLLPLIDHFLNPRFSLTGSLLWAIFIIPHEAGHLICNPFGWFPMVAGGSIWQVLPFWLLAWYALNLRGQLNGALFFWMLAGHSFINISYYARDAQERALPLLFGLGPEAHDWWNMLEALGLLEYDNQISDMILFLGGSLALLAILTGLLGTWYLPRWRPQLRLIYPYGALLAAIAAANQDADLAAYEFPKSKTL